jgi:hypothetical protein
LLFNKRAKNIRAKLNFELKYSFCALFIIAEMANKKVQETITLSSDDDEEWLLQAAKQIKQEHKTKPSNTLIPFLKSNNSAHQQLKIEQEPTSSSSLISSLQQQSSNSSKASTPALTSSNSARPQLTKLKQPTTSRSDIPSFDDDEDDILATMVIDRTKSTTPRQKFVLFCFCHLFLI